MASTRFQSVLLLILFNLSAETRVICFSLMAICPSGTDDAAAILPPCVDHVEHSTIEKAECPVAALSIVPAPVFDLKDYTFKHTRRIYKVHAVFGDIGLALSFVPLELHGRVCTFLRMIINIQAGSREYDPSILYGN